jgi:hypothetical protein
MSLAAALEELDRFAGRQFDPGLAHLVRSLPRASPAGRTRLGHLHGRCRFE